MVEKNQRCWVEYWILTV